MTSILNAGFGKLSKAAIIAKCESIAAAMSKPAMTAAFPGAASAVAAMVTANDEYKTAVQAGNAPGAATIRVAKRAVLIEQVETLALQLEGVSHDRALLAQTGFDLHKIPEHHHTPTGTPDNVKVKTTGIPGEAKLSASAVHQAKTYEGRATQDLANGPFVSCLPSTGVRGLHFTGLERGKDWFFQIRAISPNGVGPWSDPAMMMVV